MRLQRPRRADVMWSKNAHSEVGREIRRVFASCSHDQRRLCTELCTGSVDNAAADGGGPPRPVEPMCGDIATTVVGHFLRARIAPTLFLNDKLVLMTEGHRHVSESEEELPGAESLATAKLRADVARQQMRLAKDQLKRARKRFKEARREARRARKLAVMVRRAWKRQKRRRKGGESAATAGSSIVARRARAGSARRVAAKRGKVGRKATRATGRRRGGGKGRPAVTTRRKRR